MTRRKIDPKHVRDFFYNHALSVRVMTLIFDGIWWGISEGVGFLALGLVRYFRSVLPIRFSVDERLRRLHTFIVGKTGAGKSVLLHHLIRHYLVKNRKPSIVLLDPHGDLAKSVAMDKANLRNERLVYIRFGEVGGRHIHFNPFDLADPTEAKLAKAQLQFSGAVEQIIGEPFTPRQRTLIRACLGIMLHKTGANLVDLVRVLQDGQNADLVQYGQTQLPNIIDRQFFASSFADPNYRTTKLALVSRLTDIIRDPILRKFTCHNSTFNLGSALDTGKVVVVQFDPSMQGRDTIRAIGQLLNAAILSHVLGRLPQRRHPIHLFVDECQYFVSPTISEILGETRKFGLYVTLATQRLENLDPSLQDAILSNVGTLWIGSSRHITAEKFARETNISAEKIRQLPNLQFFRVSTGKPPERQRLRYIGSRYSMRPAAWRKVLTEQAKNYYQKSGAYAPTSTGSNHSWSPAILNQKKR